MKKIDYALNNLPDYWDYSNEKELIINYLCPNDFDLNNIRKCKYVTSENINYCKECWNKEKGVD